METIYDSYAKRCGEVFLTAIGDLVVYCTICETKYEDISKYVEHTRETHINDYEEDYLEEEYEQSLLDESETYKSLVSEADLKKLEELEFLAPEPDDCKEIEDFVKNFECFKEESQISHIENHNKRAVKRRCVKKDSLPMNGIVYKCPYCDATSHSRKSMNEHKLRHKGVLRHKCKVCAKAFFSTSELAVHIRIHTGERPYLCSDCGHKSKTASALRSHIISCRDIRDAECHVCNKMFRNQMYLRRHMIAHSDDRAFSCLICNSQFKQKKALQSHIKIHENQYGYKCDMCSASFNQRPGLYSHLKTKHKYFSKTL